MPANKQNAFLNHTSKSILRKSQGKEMAQAAGDLSGQIIFFIAALSAKLPPLPGQGHRGPAHLHPAFSHPAQWAPCSGGGTCVPTSRPRAAQSWSPEHPKLLSNKGQIRETCRLQSQLWFILLFKLITSDPCSLSWNSSPPWSSAKYSLPQMLLKFSSKVHLAYLQ